MKTLPVALVILCLLAASSVSAKTTTVHFSPGHSSIVLNGTTTGGPSESGGMDAIGYALRASKGQTMSLHLTSAKNNAVFMLYTPGWRSIVAEIVKDWRGTLPVTGEYQVIVFPTDEHTNTAFTLDVAIWGAGASLPGPAARASAAAVPAAQGAALRALHIRIAVPAYVPPGYRFVRVTTEPCPSKPHPCKFGPPGYTVRYAKSPSSWFEIEGTSGGIGGVDDDYSTDVRTSLFGTVALQFGTGRVGEAKAPPPALMQVVQPHLISDWGGNGPFYHLDGSGMTPADAAKVLASLIWLR